MNKLAKVVSGGVTSSILLPLFAFAQAGSIEELFDTIFNLLNQLVPILIAIAVVYFIWGVLQFVTAGADEEKRKSGRNTMIFGIIAIFVIVSVWGLVNILEGTFGLSEEGALPGPELPSPR